MITPVDHALAPSRWEINLFYHTTLGVSGQMWKLWDIRNLKNQDLFDINKYSKSRLWHQQYKNTVCTDCSVWCVWDTIHVESPSPKKHEWPVVGLITILWKPFYSVGCIHYSSSNMPSHIFVFWTADQMQLWKCVGILYFMLRFIMFPSGSVSPCEGLHGPLPACSCSLLATIVDHFNCAPI